MLTLLLRDDGLLKGSLRMKREAREIGTVFYFTGYRKNDRRKREEVAHSVSEIAAEAKERQQRERERDARRQQRREEREMDEAFLRLNGYA